MLKSGDGGWTMQLLRFFFLVVSGGFKQEALLI